jgi:hypothetical protein
MLLPAYFDVGETFDAPETGTVGIIGTGGIFRDPWGMD